MGRNYVIYTPKDYYEMGTHAFNPGDRIFLRSDLTISGSNVIHLGAASFKGGGHTLTLTNRAAGLFSLRGGRVSKLSVVVGDGCSGDVMVYTSSNVERGASSALMWGSFSHCHLRLSESTWWGSYFGSPNAFSFLLDCSMTLGDESETMVTVSRAGIGHERVGTVPGETGKVSRSECDEWVLLFLAMNCYVVRLTLVGDLHSRSLIRHGAGGGLTASHIRGSLVSSYLIGEATDYTLATTIVYGSLAEPVQRECDEEVSSSPESKVSSALIGVASAEHFPVVIEYCGVAQGSNATFIEEVRGSRVICRRCYHSSPGEDSLKSIIVPTITASLGEEDSPTKHEEPSTGVLEALPSNGTRQDVWDESYAWIGSSDSPVVIRDCVLARLPTPITNISYVDCAVGDQLFGKPPNLGANKWVRDEEVLRPLTPRERRCLSALGCVSEGRHHCCCRFLPVLVVLMGVAIIVLLRCYA
jgi:hypothetical protein